MKVRLLLSLLMTVCLISASKPCFSQDQQGYTVDYYYKIKWGYFNEFMELYKKNHYPILVELQKRGEIIDLSAAYPLYHVGESNRWDFRFTIIFKDFDAAHNNDDSDIIQELYPDQQKFRQEEQRRFELIIEHMDVPLRLESFTDW